jgi:hypothetical protein
MKEPSPGLQVEFALHVGSAGRPAGTAVIPPAEGAAIGPDEASILLGAFNRGFKMNADAGGFEVDGQALFPLVPEEASLVIDTDGLAHIDVGGKTVSTPGEEVVSVRQNLPPLVTDGGAIASVDAGAVNAMELDINPEWVQTVGAPSPGGPLSALIPGQERPADQYRAGWTRDFITVTATP